MNYLDGNETNRNHAQEGTEENGDEEEACLERTHLASTLGKRTTQEREEACGIQETGL
jgi:hypothetical protein